MRKRKDDTEERECKKKKKKKKKSKNEPCGGSIVIKREEASENEDFTKNSPADVSAHGNRKKKHKRKSSLSKDSADADDYVPKAKKKKKSKTSENYEIKLESIVDDSYYHAIEARTEETDQNGSIISQNENVCNASYNDRKKKRKKKKKELKAIESVNEALCLEKKVEKKKKKLEGTASVNETHSLEEKVKKKKKKLEPTKSVNETCCLEEKVEKKKKKLEGAASVNETHCPEEKVKKKKKKLKRTESMNETRCLEEKVKNKKKKLTETASVNEIHCLEEKVKKKKKKLKGTESINEARCLEEKVKKKKKKLKGTEPINETQCLEEKVEKKKKKLEGTASVNEMHCPEEKVKKKKKKLKGTESINETHRLEETVKKKKKKSKESHEEFSSRDEIVQKVVKVENELMSKQCEDDKENGEYRQSKKSKRKKKKKHKKAQEDVTIDIQVENVPKNKKYLRKEGITVEEDHTFHEDIINEIPNQESNNKGAPLNPNRKRNMVSNGSDVAKKVPKIEIATESRTGGKTDKKLRDSEGKNESRHSEKGDPRKHTVTKDARSRISNTNAGITAALEYQLKWQLSAKDKEELKKQGIVFEVGIWRIEEVKKLEENFESLVEQTGRAPKELLELIYDKSAQAKKIRGELCLYHTLLDGINRPIKHVHSKLKKMWNPDHFKGKWSKAEEETLLSLQKKHGNDWLEIGQKMGRSRQSVSHKFSRLSSSEVTNGSKDTINASKTRAWSSEEVTRLREAIAPFVGEDSEISDKVSEISKQIDWNRVSQAVKTRHSESCRIKWVYDLSWRATGDHGRIWTMKESVLLIKALCKCDKQYDKDIDWDKMRKDLQFPGNVSVMRRKWRSLRQKVPDYQQLSFAQHLQWLLDNYVVKVQSKGCYTPVVKKT